MPALLKAAAQQTVGNLFALYAEFLVACEVCNGVQWVHGARVGGAGRGAYKEWPVAGRTIGSHHFLELVHPHPKGVVAWHSAHVVARDTGDPRRLRE